MSTSQVYQNGTEERPRRVELAKLQAQFPLPVIEPGTVDAASMEGEAPTKAVLAVLSALNGALATRSPEALKSCFFPGQALWRDQLALTYHIRTFASADSIVASLLETQKLRGLAAGFKLSGAAHFIPATPFLQFIDCDLVFRTGSPAAECRGFLKLLPVKTKKEDGTEAVEWKIWILSTVLDNLSCQQEDEKLLQAPAKSLEGPTLETDVLIVGGGNAGAVLAARLKALGVDSIMVERNARPGDNWKLRYDCMQFHVPTSFCEMPYLSYPDALQSPHLLTKDELGEQLRKYCETLRLNGIYSAKVLSTHYNANEKRWTVKVQTPRGEISITSKHLVQATGVGSQKPYLPAAATTNREVYKGVSVHSAEFKSGQALKEKNIKTVIVIGSANTAFDVLADCYAAGLQATMNVRSPTYICPVEYVCDKSSLGAYDLGVEFGDRMCQTLPSSIDSQLGAGLFRMFASKEPDRYAPLAKAGFPVIDSTHPDAGLAKNLLESAGGHYMDIGATNLLAEGKAGIKAAVEPVAFTETGVRFSDGSVLDADAVVWCTGFSDKNASAVAAEILGGGPAAEDVAARLDATWALDEEGETRGLWKRHARVENYWTMGGFTSQHRWFSRILALQIKAALEGILPPAYLETPRQ